MADEVVLKTNSHRARHKLATVLGVKPKYYWTIKCGRRAGIRGGFVILTAAQADAVLPITGITRSRTKPADLSPCWD